MQKKAVQKTGPVSTILSASESISSKLPENPLNAVKRSIAEKKAALKETITEKLDNSQSTVLNAARDLGDMVLLSVSECSPRGLTSLPFACVYV